MRFAAATLAVACAGCGPESDMPETAPVRGVVTLDGQPVSMARIYFSPQDGGQTSEGLTDPDGRYELRYKRDVMGARLGQHKVVITTYEEPTREDDLTVSGGVPERIPAKYNQQTTLEKEVVAGENVIDFSLTAN
jgi:hypothetical protein